MELKVKKFPKGVECKLLWFNPCHTVFYTKSPRSEFSLHGKGYGMLEDKEGNRYFLYGGELGGGYHGEDADPKFIKVGTTYIIKEAWINDETMVPRMRDTFFMGCTLRAKSITLKNGKKPGKDRYKKIVARIKKASKLKAA